jgi:hypothetical protein
VQVVFFKTGFLRDLQDQIFSGVNALKGGFERPFGTPGRTTALVFSHIRS